DEVAPSAAELARDEDEFLEELESLIGGEAEDVIEPEIRFGHGRVEPPSDADLDDAAVTPIEDAFDDAFDDPFDQALVDTRDDVLDRALDDALEDALDKALGEAPVAGLDEEPDE
ncbi:hypothetical protein V6O07_09035, partial [Arthrospira platensis SPKY2]